jgi:hypothetical protein
VQKHAWSPSSVFRRVRRGVALATAASCSAGVGVTGAEAGSVIAAEFYRYANAVQAGPAGKGRPAPVLE